MAEAEAVIAASRAETAKLNVKIAGAKSTSSQAYSDTQKLLQIIVHVEAACRGYKTKAADAEAAEAAANAAQIRAEAASQCAQETIDGLLQAATSFAVEKGCLEWQKGDAARVIDEARCAAKQTQQGIQAFRTAASEANAVCDGLAAQVTNLQTAKAEAQMRIEFAQQLSKGLDVDVAAAEQALQRQADKLQHAKADALAANSQLQVTFIMSNTTQSSYVHL